MLIYSITSITYPVLLSRLIDQGIVNSDSKLCKLYFFLFCITALVTIVSYYIKSIQFTKLGQDVSLYLKTNIISKFNEYDETFFDKHKSGEILSILENDIKKIENVLTTNLSNIIVNIITIVGMIVIFYLSSKIISLCIVVLLGIYIGYQKKIGKKIKKQSILVSMQQGEVYSQTEEFINDYLDVRNINAVEFLFNKYQKCNKKFYYNDLKLVRLQQLTVVGGIIVQYVGILFVLFIGGQLVSKNMLTIGTLFSLIIYSQKIFSPILSLSNNYIQMKNVSASIKRVIKIVDEKIISGDQDINFKNQNNPMIRFNDVSYGCGNSLLVEELNLDINNGDKVAILGENGSGKSTMIKLLLRIKNDYRGKVYISNCDLRTVSTDAIRENILYIPQKSLVFNDTLRNNILMGHEIKSHQSLEDIIKLVGLEREINEWEDGLDTLLGSSGVNLSGGQKRKISLARAFVIYPQLLILDEPSADLDFLSEDLVCRNIFEIFENRTIIVITHREKVLERCNKIFKINNKKMLLVQYRNNNLDS